MKKGLYLILSLVMLLSAGVVSTSCSSDDSPSPAEEPAKSQPNVRITETIRMAAKKATVYNIEYLSSDPFGQPVTLSGSIVVGDEVDANNKKAE